jgi:RNA polymerase sigma-70 factor, ECF subfamily
MGGTELEDATHEALRAGTEAWPGVPLAEADFASWLESRGISLDSLRAYGPDLYLAAACARGDRRALELFDRAFLQPPGPSLGRITLTPTQLDELRQRLRVRLLTGPEPRIAGFQGNGPLAAWVRVAGVRIAADLQWGDRPMGAGEDALVDALAYLGADPELVTARREHREAFREALEEAIGRLDAREKTLLRLSFIDEMSIDDIRHIYRVHRSTVARWLVAMRRQVFEHVCQRLSIKLRSSPSEVASLVRLVRSEVDLSIRRLLVEGADTPTPVASDEGNGTDDQGPKQ